MADSVEETLSETTPQQPVEQRKKLPLRTFAIAGIVCLVGIVLIINLATSAWRGGPPAASIGQATAAFDAQQQLAEVQAVQWAQQEKRVLAKTKLTQTGELGKKALDAVIILENQIKRWETEIVPLLANDRGRLLASKKEHVQTVSAVLERPRPSVQEAQAIRAAITNLLAPITEALADESSFYAPGDAVKQSLQEQKEAADQAAGVYQDHLAIILGLLPPGVSAPPPNVPSLEAAIGALKREQAADQAAIINAEEEKARKENDERLAKAKAEQVRVQGAAEEQKIRAQTEQMKTQNEKERRQLEAQTDQIKADMDAEETRMQGELAVQQNQAEADRVRKLAADPEVQRKYQPFLAKGYWRGTYGEKNEFPYPLSLSFISSSGALRSPENFAKAGAGTIWQWRYNDRPRWAYPASLEEMDKFKPLLEEFKEVAPYWVEMKLLLP